MNIRQKWALWIGVLLFLVAGLFPPWVSDVKMPNGPTMHERSFHFIVSRVEEAEMSVIDTRVLTVEWAIVLVSCAAAVLTFAGMNERISDNK